MRNEKTNCDHTSMKRSIKKASQNWRNGERGHFYPLSDQGPFDCQVQKEPHQLPQDMPVIPVGDVG